MGADRVDSLQQGILMCGDAHENPCVTSGKGVKGETSIVESLPTGFQQEPVLGIHLARLTGGNTEKPAIKEIDMINETGLFGDSLAGFSCLRVIVNGMIPALWGNIANSVGSLQEQAPKGLGVAHSTRQTTADTDDGDRLAFLRYGVCHVLNSLHLFSSSDWEMLFCCISPQIS
jgi:hypothetical protein